MAFFTLACAFHNTSRLLERTLPLAIRTLTRPTRHEFEVVLVADRSSDTTVADLLPRLRDLGVDELRFRRTARLAFDGAPSNNFHGHHFTTTKPYLISFTDDTFMLKTEDEFDVLDAVERIFTRHPEVPLISKVDDHDEWDAPLVDIGSEIEPGVRSVNRAVDQLIMYDTARFAGPAARLGAWHPETFVGHPGFEYQWENLASHVGTTGGRRIAYPESWPLRVRHSDLRNQPGSMHGTQDEDVKIKCFERLVETSGLAKT
ncbi:hypothetical protein FZ103_09690 [Streptomonospora sp. PA3]|uniref:hypothetical protein n=1 Tax=Streptomonospora sp. PA3 TaxID=2607326 RepID=UPI0012DDBB65|nr:hypothetical protein [Streptomonospora sp. PA3]MUL41442.1 hypothetical protein [Streptomonospora sp. PA3]